MNSSTFRTLEKRREQDEIKKQIELLKAKLDDPEPEPRLVEVRTVGAENLKMPLEQRKREGEGEGGEMLAPNTPSPRKKRKVSHPNSYSSGPTISKLSFNTHPIVRSSSTKPSTTSTSTNPSTTPMATTQPSTLFSSLRRLGEAAAGANDENEGMGQAQRTVGFEDKPRQQESEPRDTPRRDERLALVEDFEMGPYEFTPPVGDPEFKAFEPHSGIALLSRILPHIDLADYLVGRFYISPSKLYSLLRVDMSCTNTNKNPHKGGYDLDVPVPGDWVTIAVIAERGPIKYTKAPVGVEKDEEDIKVKKKWDATGKKEKPAVAEGGGKKYVTLKMIDFGARSQSSGDGYRQIRGDGFLNLILFEADRFDLITQGNFDGKGARRKGRGEEKVYKGGSGGAFEKLMDVREGDVVALLNPRVMKPFQRTNSPPQAPILAMTPPSASSILIIGRSRDLGMCTVVKADGKVCGSWCDKRAVVGSSSEDREKGSVCEYHLERAVMRRRAGRNEFAIGTSGMTTSATHKRKHDYDPLRKWGLKPSNDTGSGSSSGGHSSAGPGGLGATYVFAGHVVSNSNVAASSMFVNETMGREAQAKARRKMGDGRIKEEEALVSRVVGKGRGRSRGVTDKLKEQEDDSGDEGKAGGDKKNKKSKPLYSAEFIKSLGFDPSLKAGIGSNGPGGRSGISKSVRDKLDALETLQQSRSKEAIELGPRRGGPRVRSGVVVPVCKSRYGEGEGLVDVPVRAMGGGSGSGKEDLEGEGEHKDDDTEKMVDLDDED